MHRFLLPLVAIALVTLLTACIAPIQDNRPESQADAVTPAEAPAAAEEKPAPEMIEADYEAGVIDAGEQLLYLTYAIYEPESLPERYANDVPWRGTMTVQTIKSIAASPDFCTYAPDVRAEVARLVQGAHQCE